MVIRFCANAVLSYGDHILTFQPHPEFDASFTKGLIDHRGQGVVPDDLLNSAKSRLQEQAAQPEMAERIARHFQQEKEDVMSNDLETFLSSLPQHAQDYLTGRKLDEVECVIADLPGIARGKAVPAAKYARQGSFHLPDSIFYQTITGDWGEAAGAEGFIERDMIMRPDHSTTSAAPWTGDWTLQVIHDAFDRGGTVPFAPRNVLKRVVELYKKGMDACCCARNGVLLVARNIDPAKSIQPMMGRSGRPAAARQAYSMTAVDEFGPVIDDIYDFAEAQGFEIDGITQEGGAGQLEINLRHGDPVRLADEVFYFKRLIREAALRHDCFATFMAKPIEDEPGSAMHIHHSIIDTKLAEYLFWSAGWRNRSVFLFHRRPAEIFACGDCVLAPYVIHIGVM